MHAHAANACGGAPMHRAVGAQVGAVQQLAAQEHWRATSAALSALAGGAADRSATASHASANALAPSLPALQGLPAQGHPAGCVGAAGASAGLLQMAAVMAGEPGSGSGFLSMQVPADTDRTPSRTDTAHTRGSQPPLTASALPTGDAASAMGSAPARSGHVSMAGVGGAAEAGSGTQRPSIAHAPTAADTALTADATASSQEVSLPRGSCAGSSSSSSAAPAPALADGGAASANASTPAPSEDIKDVSPALGAEPGSAGSSSAASGSPEPRLRDAVKRAERRPPSPAERRASWLASRTRGSRVDPASLPAAGRPTGAGRRPASASPGRRSAGASPSQGSSPRSSVSFARGGAPARCAVASIQSPKKSLVIAHLTAVS